ncbi:uncharacterized protein PAC_11709 [Phialocephala subalpina]|uniref:Uncharacterized protein n=1 Tax=Phialocephala subalpina TaxID=576137 RepID=A0A1L7X9X9_9HELO|nr:uncharacterized protein PAC_11709 [Phialocephala subalpina]
MRTRTIMATPQDNPPENSMGRRKQKENGDRFTFGIYMIVSRGGRTVHGFGGRRGSHLYALGRLALYSKRLRKSMIVVSGKRVRMMDLFKLWVLGQRFLMPELQNAVMESTTPFTLSNPDFFGDDQLTELEARENIREWFLYAYDNTAKDSHLRRYSTAMMISMLEWSKTPLEPEYNNDITAGVYFKDQSPPEMAVDFLKCMVKSSPNVGKALLAVEVPIEFLVPTED